MPPRTTSILCLIVALSLPSWTVAQTDSDVRNDSLLAEELLNNARQHHNAHHYAEEITSATKAIDIFTRLYGSEHPKTAFARMFIARGLRELNREQEALHLYFQNLPVFETARDTLRQAICHHQIGLTLRKQYRFREVHHHEERALELLRSDSVRFARAMADVWLGIGSALNAEKKFHAAIPPLENARAVYADRQNHEGLGYAGYHLGNAWFGLHDFTRAREQYLFALSKLKNLLKPGDSYFADLYVKIGWCCQQMEEAEAGLRYLLEAKDIYLREGAEDLDYIQFLQDLGSFYLREKQPELAIEQLEACVSANEKYYGGKDFHLIGTLQVLAEAYVSAHWYAQAEVCYRQVLRIIDEHLGGNYAQLFRVYTKLAELSFAQGDWSSCLLRCDTAFAAVGYSLQTPSEVLPRDHFRELCLLYSRTQYRVWEQTRDIALLSRSEHYAALAAETLFHEVEEITVNSSREIFYDLDHPALEHWLDTRISLFVATGDARHVEVAFQIAGKSKAFLLAEAMRQLGALRYAGIPDTLILSESSLRQRIVFAEKELETFRFMADAHQDSNLLWLNSNLTEWRQEYDALLRQIEREHPAYFQLRKLGRDIPSDELHRRALAPDQALLLFSQTANNLHLFVRTRDTLLVHTLPMDARLNDALEQMQQSLSAYHTADMPTDALYDSSLDRYVIAAQEVYQQLIAPVAAVLPERIVLIPDGKLWHLPFGALLSGAPVDVDNFRTYPFWLREKALSYCLSPNLLLEIKPIPGKKAEKKWLGIAPFSRQQDVQTAEANRRFHTLPYSGEEVQAIAALVKGDVWLGAAASLTRFRNDAPHYTMLHLATHSQADDRQGDFSFVAASSDGELLLAKDLFALALAADMVVLSACEAGGGRLLRGEGIIGLVRGFLYAGARSVVASQWVAHDRSTANLMVDFYRNLQQGMPKDRALRKAQINFAQQHPAQAHPFFWAGFLVYGNLAPCTLR